MKEITPGTFTKTIYLYLVSFVALLMVAFSLADAIQVVLKTYIFTRADQAYYGYAQPVCDTNASTTPANTNPPCLSATEQKKQQDDNMVAMRQSSIVHDIAYILIGLPLFAFHWRLARKKE